MISAFVIKSCADLAGVRHDLALDLADALQEPLGPGFEPLARVMDAHGVEALRDILRRLLRAEEAVPRPVAMPTNHVSPAQRLGVDPDLMAKALARFAQARP